LQVFVVVAGRTVRELHSRWGRKLKEVRRPGERNERGRLFCSVRVKGPHFYK